MGKIKILANDGMGATGKELLEEKGFEVITTRVAQEQLINFINDNNMQVLLVRSATKVGQDVLDACPTLRLVGRGGVGMDNIALKHAKHKGIPVINTPTASSAAVAELVIAHLLSGIRFLHDSNRNMPLEGDHKFGQLKKSYSGASELGGKTLGIVGFGQIGQAVAQRALGMGMKVLFHDHHSDERTITVPFFDGQEVYFTIAPNTLEEVLQQSDFITIHVPAQKDYVIGEKEIAKLKDGAGVINAARGGTLDEVALVKALDDGKVAFAGLDVFESEPSPEIRILMHPKISLSPHIGGSTVEAQKRISVELAEQIIDYFQ